MTTGQLPCPTCGRLTPISTASHLPFCSERCRLIDLGRWLDEDHALPVTSADDDESTDTEHDAGASSHGDHRPAVRLPPGWHDA